MFYHFEEVKVTLVVPKSRKKMRIIFLRLLGITKVTLSSSKKHNFWSVKRYLTKKLLKKKEEKTL